MFRKIKLNFVKLWYQLFNEKRLQKTDFQRTTNKEDYSIFLKILSLVNDPDSTIIQTNDTFVISTKKSDSFIHVKIGVLNGRDVSVNFIETSPSFSIKERLNLGGYAMVRIKEMYEQKKLDQISSLDSLIKTNCDLNNTLQ